MASGIIPGVGSWLKNTFDRPAPTGPPTGLSKPLIGGQGVVDNIKKALTHGAEFVAQGGKQTFHDLYHQPPPQNTTNPTPVDPSFQKQLSNLNHPKPPEPLSYQALMTKALEPMIKALGTNPQTTAAGINQALGQYKSGTPQSLQHTIASTLHTTISDWQGGLQSMLNNIGTTTPAQALLSGMGTTLSYPTSTTLSGTEGAPAAVANSDTLLALYQQLLAERNGQTPSTSATPSALNGLLAGY